MINENYDLSKKSHAESYFSAFLSLVKNIKVKAIYTPAPFLISEENEYTIMADQPIYIVFENGKCLAVEYYYIDELMLDYREMTKEEKRIRRKDKRKDFFNYKNITYKNYGDELIPDTVYKVQSPYGCISKIKVESVKGKYNKWLSTGLESVQATAETFNKIVIELDNSNELCIYAEDAEIDGYCIVYTTYTHFAEYKIEIV